MLLSFPFTPCITNNPKKNSELELDTGAITPIAPTASTSAKETG